MTQPTPTSTLASPSHSTLHGSYHNVLSYGAVGDGVADDTAEIQAAIDAASAVGEGHVLLPAGNYKISSALTLNATKSVRISGVNGTNADPAMRNRGRGSSAPSLPTARSVHPPAPTKPSSSRTLRFTISSNSGTLISCNG